MFRVWWFTQIHTNIGDIWLNPYYSEFPSETKESDVLHHAMLILEELANYNLSLGDVISANTGGLEYRENETEEWQEWRSEDGLDIYEYFEYIDK